MQAADRFAIRPATNADRYVVAELVFGVLAEFGLEPDKDGTDRDLVDLEAAYTARGGVFEVIEDVNGRVLGCVGLYPLDAATVELRKMYFAPELRGRGWGERVLVRMIELARRLGYGRIYLETASLLQAAVHLYEKHGFRPTPEKHTPRCDQAYILDLANESSSIR